jgi:hypothetical protein
MYVQTVSDCVCLRQNLAWLAKTRLGSRPNPNLVQMASTAAVGFLDHEGMAAECDAQQPVLSGRSAVARERMPQQIPHVAPWEPQFP